MTWLTDVLFPHAKTKSGEMNQLWVVVVIGISSVFVRAGAVSAEVIEPEGKVKSIDKDARTISIARKTSKGEKTLDLEIAKKAGDLTEVQEGDSVSFSYDTDLELVTKIAEEGKQAEKIASVGNDGLARPFLDKLLTAIKQNDYDSYVADYTASFKAVTTKQIVAGISEQLAPRMKKGYEVIFLTELKQRGQKAYLWKLTFKDGGDDVSAKVWLKDGKVSGFLLQ
jgi:hypothetical protein